MPAASTSPQAYLQSLSRWRPIEIAFWLATLLPFFLFPDYLALASQIAIAALFALSLDLILGYAGVVSLGHAAFFGIGAYTAGIFSKTVWGEPLTGLLVAAAIAGLAGYASSFIISRFRHLTLIMITLGLGLLMHEAANRAHWLTGGSDGLQGVSIWPVLGWRRCSCASSPCAVSLIHRSAWRCAASARTGCVCRRSARRAARISARPIRSPPFSPVSPARFWRRRRRPCRSNRSASSAPPTWW
jgi:ABC-type branched-subunit amino acid transport system permease subunit